MDGLFFSEKSQYNQVELKLLFTEVLIDWGTHLRFSYPTAFSIELPVHYYPLFIL